MTVTLTHVVGDTAVYDPAVAAGGPAAFLKLRLADAAAAGVASVSWCMMWGIAIEGPGARYWQTAQLNQPFLPEMPDPTVTVAEFCHDEGVEVFGAIRMNVRRPWAST